MTAAKQARSGTVRSGPPLARGAAGAGVRRGAAGRGDQTVDDDGCRSSSGSSGSAPTAGTAPANATTPSSSFTKLIDDDEIYPTDDDYRRLFLDRQRRFVEFVPQHARAAREEAMSNLRTIVEAQLGHPLDRQVDARIVADVVGDIAEISVAFELTGLNQQEILLLVRSFAPEPDVAWEWSDSLAGRRLRPGEIAFS